MGKPSALKRAEYERTRAQQDFRDRFFACALEHRPTLLASAMADPVLQGLARSLAKRRAPAAQAAPTTPGKNQGRFWNR